MVRALDWESENQTLVKRKVFVFVEGRGFDVTHEMIGEPLMCQG